MIKLTWMNKSEMTLVKVGSSCYCICKVIFQHTFYNKTLNIEKLNGISVIFVYVIKLTGIYKSKIPLS